jgi:hypothetical protein
MPKGTSKVTFAKLMFLVKSFVKLVAAVAGCGRLFTARNAIWRNFFDRSGLEANSAPPGRRPQLASGNQGRAQAESPDRGGEAVQVEP